MNTILLIAAIPSSFFVLIAFLELLEEKITLSAIGHCLFTLGIAASFFCVTFVIATGLSFSVR
jgi:hypothetical protein